MVNKKKKKGSSLLVTVAMFAILSILIMSVLAMTTSGYSLRIKNNKRIENFYAADSGLEISQKVIHDYLGEVVRASLNKVDKYTKEQPEGKLSQSEKEEKFEEFFKGIILNGGELIDESLVFIKDLRKLKEEVELPANYDSFKREGKNIEIKGETKAIDESGGVISSPTIPYRNINKFSLNVKSNFMDKDNKEREVEVDFDILIPEYGKLLIKSKSSGAPNILNYIVGVDGDYTITTDTTTTVLGDMWVKGNGKNNDINSENKYDGGILVRQPLGSTYGAPEVKWNGTIATNSTLDISNIIFKSGVTSTEGEKNIFARNVRINNDETKSGDSKLFGPETNLHVYNDFVMEGKDNNVELKNYYGLNDINDYEANWVNRNLKKAQKSSAMIINSSDFGMGSSIKVLNDLFILGTSYLDLGSNDYQTGQSTIMNNISRPYTMRYDDYIYQYKSYEDGGIQIATKDKDGNDIQLNGDKGKVELAKKFYETNSDYFKAGITAPKDKIASTGVILANGEVLDNKQTLTNEKLNKAKEKQNRFVQEVFYMGSEEEYGQREFWNNKLNVTVNESFNWEEINNIAKDYYKDSPGESDDGKLIFKGGNNNDFIHLTTKKNINEILSEAKTDRHEFGKYDSASILGSNLPNLILSNSTKEIVLRNTGSGDSRVVSESSSQIIYEVNIGSGNTAPPLLVIAKGKITFEPFNGYNHIMLISADNAEIKIPYGDTATIGNYNTGTSEGKNKLINELFKYVLESDGILGGIGDGIFKGNEDKITTNAIEVSNLIKSKNWKLNK